MHSLIQEEARSMHSSDEESRDTPLAAPMIGHGEGESIEAFVKEVWMERGRALRSKTTQ